MFEFSHAVLGILLAGTLMLLVGLIDDLGVLSPWAKLASQFIAVIALIKAGIFIKLVFVPPLAALAVSALWFLAVTNAFNIIDIMDGLASGVAAIAAVFFALVAIAHEEATVAVMAAALGGSLVGFLRYNSAPARIYLGDSGSLFIGLTLAALATNGGYTRSNLVAALTPVIFLGVPLFDLAFVSMLRLEQGLSPLRGSPDHFALRLRRAGFGVRHTVLVAYAATFVLCVVGLATMNAPNDNAAMGIVIGLCVMLLVLAAALRRTG
jgi:UDP-GlcNAc:undecaprenyl-phosphate GlcNAc-1-phosphate transferase